MRITFAIILTVLILFKLDYIHCQSELNHTNDATDYLSQQIGYLLNFSVITGYFPIDWYYPSSTKTGIFFQMTTKKGEFLNNTSPDTAIIFWFSGGPGQSSLSSSFFTMGPLFVNDDIIVEEKVNSWNNLATIVFVDQPLGIGLSHTDSSNIINSTMQSGSHFINFLYHFYKQFPQLQQNPTYISGISYGGHYVPYYAYSLLNNNSFAKVNYQGATICGAWVDSVLQSNQYDTVFYSVGVASGATKKMIKGQLVDFANEIANNNLQEASEILESVDDLYSYQYGYVDADNFDEYLNITGEDDQVSSYEVWLEDKDNRQAFGIPDYVEFCEFNDTIYGNYSVDGQKSFMPYLEFLMKMGKVVIYQGQNDINVPLAGVQYMINQLKWDQLSKWKKAIKQIWKYDNQTVGTFKSYENFSFLVVYKSGHSVQYDQILLSLDILNRTLTWNWQP